MVADHQSRRYQDAVTYQAEIQNLWFEPRKRSRRETVLPSWRRPTRIVFWMSGCGFRLFTRSSTTSSARNERSRGVIYTLHYCRLRGLDLKNIQDGGEAILEAFRGLKIEYVISSPGSEWPSLWEALARQKKSGMPGPAYLDCGHETLAIAMATGYTQVTGRMQAVLLHAGAGLLQGSMAIYGARAQAAPILVMSGESAGYGEGDFDPGPQWYRNLSVVGGPQRLVDPLVKIALQSNAVETLYHSVVRAGEIAQRTPRGPTYLCVSMEAMIAEWSRPETMHAAAPPPASRPTTEDIAKVATELAQVAIAIHSGGACRIRPSDIRGTCRPRGATRDPSDRRAGSVPFEFPEVARSLPGAGYESVSGRDGLCSSH